VDNSTPYRSFLGLPNALVVGLAERSAENFCLKLSIIFGPCSWGKLSLRLPVLGFRVWLRRVELSKSFLRCLGRVLGGFPSLRHADCVQLYLTLSMRVELLCPHFCPHFDVAQKYRFHLNDELAALQRLPPFRDAMLGALAMHRSTLAPLPHLRGPISGPRDDATPIG
jgi:hypothetical protein